MVLSKRERFIAIGVAAAVGLLVLDKAVIGPLWDRVSEAADRKENLQKRLNAANTVLDLSRRLGPRWNDMMTTGVKSDPAEAEGQVVQAIHNWAADSRVTIQMVRADRQPPAKDASLYEIAFQVGGTGPMLGVAQLLWRMQYATIPLKITEIQLASTKDATDNLSATVRLSTVYMPVASTRPAGGGR